MMRNKIIFLSLLIGTIANSQIIYNGVGHIPSQNQREWFKAGRLPDTGEAAVIKIEVDDFTGESDDDDKIKAAINNAQSYIDEGLVIIHFSARNYTLDEKIELNLNSNPNLKNIIFQGEGLDTKLNFNIDKNNNCFKIIGKRLGIVSVLTDTDLPAKTKLIHPKNPTYFNEKEWIHFYEYNFPIEGSSTNYVGQITQIETISGNEYKLKDKFSRHYDLSGFYHGNDFRIQKLEPIKNIGIENLAIYRENTNYSDSNNNGSNIFFQYAVNCWVNGVFSHHTSTHHINIRYSSNIEVVGSYLDNARYKGNGGYGYGVNVEASSNYCLIENNILKKLRHALVVQKGANTNVIVYNYSREQEWVCGGGCPDGEGSDLLLHGRYPFANLFEHNYVIRIQADDEHGEDGPEGSPGDANNGTLNTFVRNYSLNGFHISESGGFNVLGNQLWWPRKK